MNGCNTSAFSPNGPKLADMEGMKRPIWLYVGRVSHEKNVLALLELHDKIKGSIAIVGKGPFFQEAKERFESENVKFLGWRQGEELYSAYRSADAFAFTSRTDTFGQVNIEAMASGLPVAAFPVTGPIDLVVDGCGAVDDDLLVAMKKAIATKDVQKCLEHARSFSWEEMTTKFLEPETRGYRILYSVFGCTFTSQHDNHDFNSKYRKTKNCFNTACIAQSQPTHTICTNANFSSWMNDT